MVKEHTIKLNINNDTLYTFTFMRDWFDSGRLAEGFTWPSIIQSKFNHTVVLYEAHWSLAGCSGYVQYMMGYTPVTIAFSNPSVGMNKVGVGTNLPYVVSFLYTSVFHTVQSFV